ncbi:MAG: SBBP repeat-containing protein [Flavobacteriales bacterium]
MKTITLTILAAIMAGFAHGQSVEWVRCTGSSASDSGTSIALDSDGNVYSTGYFSGEVTFDDSNPEGTLFSTSTNAVFIQKIDPSGNLIWVKQILAGLSYADNGQSIAIDSDNNVYVTGYFLETVDFNPGSEEFNLTSAGDEDVYVLKLNENGDFIWAISLGGIGTDLPASLICDGNEYVYVTGYFTDAIDLNPGQEVMEFTSSGYEDVFIAKLDNSGSISWANSYGGVNSDYSGDISIDDSGNIYTIGYFSDDVDFDSSLEVFELNAQNGFDIFIQKLDAQGTFIWAKSFSGINHDYAYSIAIDSENNIYTTGYFANTVDFDPNEGTAFLTATGDNDLFIHKMDENGNMIWVKSIIGSNWDQSQGIATDASGNIYITGLFYGLVDFDPNDDVSNMQSSGNYDVFILKLDPQGNFVWNSRIGGPGYDQSMRIRVDALNNIYSTGFFNDVADFSATESISSNGMNDIYVHKISQETISNQNELELDHLSLSLFPNPSADLIQLNLDKSLNDISIEIQDSNGKVLKNQYFNTLHQLTLELPYPSGIYFIIVQSKNEKGVYRIVKE